MSSKTTYSPEQMIADINSHAYRTDPDFREVVLRKVAGMNTRGTGKQFQSGAMDLGKGVVMGGFTYESAPERSDSAPVGRQGVSIDPTAVNSGDGFNSAEDLIRAVNCEEYRRNPAFREMVARAYEATGPAIDRKV